jgi:hypothetical protein
MDRVATTATASISLARVLLNAFNNLRRPEGRCIANLDSSDSRPSHRSLCHSRAPVQFLLAFAMTRNLVGGLGCERLNMSLTDHNGEK